MKVNLITNTLPRYRKTDNQQTKSSQLSYSRDQASYMTNISPSFNGIFGLGRKVATKAAEIAGPSVITQSKKESSLTLEVIKRLDQIREEETKDPDSLIDYSLKHIISTINDETAPFADKLVDLLTPSQIKGSLISELDQINALILKFKQYPQARNTMQKALDIETKRQNNYSFSNLTNLFNHKYIGSEIQNRFIEKILNAKGFDGKPRFNQYSTNSTFEYLSTSEQEQAFDLILHKVVVGSDHISIKKLAKAINKSLVKDFEKNKEEAIIPGKKQFLVDSEYDINCILQNIDADKLSVLKTILSRASNADGIGEVLKNYTPEKQAFFEKGLKLVDAGKLSLNRLGKALKYADKN